MASRGEQELTEPPDGPLYEGETRDGQPHGRGTLFWSEGCKRYEGEWQNGRRHGRGSAFLSDGFKVYEGEWRDNLKHGRGTYTWPDGDRHEGEWQAGRYHGQGTLYRPDGTVTYEGEWRDGARNGRGTAYRPNGTVLFEGECGDTLLVELFGEELDQLSANDQLETYRREFTGDRSEWLGRHQPTDEGSDDPENMVDWRICYDIETV